MFKTPIAILTAAVLTAFALCSCAGDESVSIKDSSSDTQTSAPVEEKLPQTEEEWHQAMIDKSLTSYGNVSKMQEKLNAAQNGEEINISYLGGSITEGVGATADTCWAKLTFDYIAEKFGTGENVTYNNAGISGTPSKLGILRLERDVLEFSPDICFVEFAVNDGMEADYQRSYEAIIRTLIENDVAVVLVFARTEDGHTCQEYMQTQGEYYSLPMISYNDAITYMFDNGKMTWQDFSDDKSHPNTNGHALVAEMVENYFDGVMEQSAEEYVLPTEPLNDLWSYGAKLYENTDITPVSMGGWTIGSSISRFTNGWTHNANLGNEPIVFNVSGKFVYLLYKEVAAGNYSPVKVTIKANGELFDEIEINPVSPNGWGNCQTICLAMSPTVLDYEIEISPVDESSGGSFEILGLAVTNEN